VFKEAHSSNDVDRQGLYLLKKRETDIVALLTEGKTNAEIAGELFLSEGYVRNQLVEIREKLGLRNSKELAVWGAKMGL
jgi:DNA-binding NarL/FixJ family response regulator